MNRPICRTIVRYLPFVCVVVLATVARAQWTTPTDEELKMTSQAEAPGAAAVYLNKDEVTDDLHHTWSFYVRLKVLTERGKDYANVELKHYQGEYTIKDIAGRTIHPDGTIVPFTGKPFDKLIEKSRGYKEMAKVFTLPAVEVGSILEYSYKLHYDGVYYIPDWYIQSDLYTRKAHYLWNESIDDSGYGPAKAISWTPILPPGAEVKATRKSGQVTLELSVHDVPPTPDEEFMPPIASLSYRVLFYYSVFKSIDDFWKGEGVFWTKSCDDFIGPGPKVRAAVKQIVSDSDTQEQKLRKIYAAVMKLDNTAFDRQISAAEAKARGLNKIQTTDDIWEHQRGNDDQIANLFIAMARAAGLKAYAMLVTARDHNIFQANYLSFSQLDDYIAIVSVDGKEQYFDPGQRYCPYGHLAWQHTTVKGIRQTDGAATINETPPESYTASRIQRIANLTLDEHGEAAGTISMTWIGAPALYWRHNSLRNDTAGFDHDLRIAIEHLLPDGAEVKVSNIQNLDDYEKPLIVSYDIKAAIGSSTGKRMLVPGDIFEMNSKPTFPHEKRTLPVYFDYPETIQDAVRINFPETLGVESLPAVAKLPFQKLAAYSYNTASTPTSVTVRRDFVLGSILFTTAEYPDLRTFYNDLETKDQESVVLKNTAPAPAGN
jgi:hypothetical protein